MRILGEMYKKIQLIHFYTYKCVTKSDIKLSAKWMNVNLNGYISLN